MEDVDFNYTIQTKDAANQEVGIISADSTDTKEALDVLTRFFALLSGKGYNKVPNNILKFFNKMKNKEKYKIILKPLQIVKDEYGLKSDPFVSAVNSTRAALMFPLKEEDNAFEIYINRKEKRKIKNDTKKAERVLYENLVLDYIQMTRPNA